METGELVRNFVAGILKQAVTDYRDKPHRREEVMEFFKSQWGKELCEIVNIDNTTVIKELNVLLLKGLKNGGNL